MFKIVLTGGPCGGKSTSMAKLESTLTARGYKVLIVPETATELILNGIHPSENISMDRFQDFVLSKQISKEKLYDEVAKQFDTDKLVILYDRGIGDQLAYISTDTLKEKINKHKIDLNNAVNRYDLVLHLTTAADGTDAYEWKGSETCGNMARSESPEEAIQKDRLTLNGWINAGCEHVKVIDNSTDFDGKISRILEEVFSLLGEPTPCEIERKYLIKKPSLEVLNKLNSCSKSNIIQTYLKRNNPETERRIRLRGTVENGFQFYLTEKTDKSFGERIEIERKISQREYINLLTEADTLLHQISKERYCFIYEKQFFELDIYPFSDEYSILEIELKNINEKVKLPDFLDVIKEVTDDKSYRNSELAKTLTLK